MKRLFVLTIVALFALTGIGSPVAVSALERWKLQMYDPAVTTDRKINIEYKVMSIVAEDTFTVRLYRDGAQSAQQTISTDYGDSGVFTVNLPASGTYQYKISATNKASGATPKTLEESRTVRIEDGPEPTVRTITVTNAQPAGGQGAGDGAAQFAAAGDADGAQAGVVGDDGQVLAQGDGDVAQAGQNGENGEGQTTDDAATAQGQDDGSVLGEEADENQEESGGTSVRAAIILALIAAAVGYGAYRYSPRSKE